jgi:UDP-N-acetylglucosamine/UDP-N-acetylgalactosamine diphosphorylase
VHRVVGDRREQLFAEGLQEIANGRVAAILMGGGQGTRLGSSEPKGLFNVGLPSGKSLLQIQAERLRRVQQLAKDRTGKTAVIPWYIMTSEATDELTERFFAANKFFGLDPTQVRFFEQGRYPSLLENGKIAMSSAKSLSLSPNGNGGIYEAVHRNKVLQELKEKGIEYVFVYGVDNIAIRICDPAFIGLLKSEGGDCGVKVVPKDYPEERVGVVAYRNNKPSVVEYSELDSATAQKTDETGKLLFNTGNICTHLYTLDFLQRSCEQYASLAKHVAHKAIPHYDTAAKKMVYPAKENGFKFEMFVFDVFALSTRLVAMEVVRDEEFLPLKNKDGTPDSNPTTCREGISNLHKRFVRNAGGVVEGEGLCEVSPLLSYAGEGLEKLLHGKTLRLPVQLNEESAAKL